MEKLRKQDQVTCCVLKITEYQPSFQEMQLFAIFCCFWALPTGNIWLPERQPGLTALGAATWFPEKDLVTPKSV